ncbi:MAG: DUF6508 domain-containing protein [Chloroflexota bacterium]
MSDTVELSAKELAQMRRLAAFEDTFGSADFTPGTWSGGNADADGVIQMPWFSYSETVDWFRREMSGLGMVYPFDWPAWSRTPEGERLMSGPGAIATATAADLARVLTTLVRGDRFSEGLLADAFERGTIAAMTRRAAELVRAAEPKA